MSSDDALAGIQEQLERMNKRIGRLEDENEELRAENKRLRNGEPDDDKEDPPENDEVIDNFIEYKNPKGRNEYTYRTVYRRFRDFTDDDPLPELGKTDVRNWINNLGVKPTTSVEYLTKLKVLWDWMDEQPWGPEENPPEAVREKFRNDNQASISRAKSGNGTYLTPEEFVKALGALPRANRDRAILVLGAKTGLRRKQIQLLKVEDVHLDGRTPSYVDADAPVVIDRFPKGHGDESDDGPLSNSEIDHRDEHLIDDETVSALQDWMDVRDKKYPDNPYLWPSRKRSGKPVSHDSLGRIVRKATDRAANVLESSEPELSDTVRQFAAHDMRHCFTDWLRKDGCPDYMVRALRGDMGTDIIDRYTNPATEKRKKYDKHVPRFGIQ